MLRTLPAQRRENRAMARSKAKTSRRAAEQAVRTLLSWAGEDPGREGLRDTPQRVVDAYRDWFSGYQIDPAAYLRRTFEEVGGYDEVIVLRDISFESHCEHHMAPIIGRVHIGYLPAEKVVGISKLVRVVEGYARRFQVQENLTAQIADCITQVLRPRGVGVVVDAVHECMTTRGVHKRGVSMVTSRMTGTFRSDARTRTEFLSFIGISRTHELLPRIVCLDVQVHATLVLHALNLHERLIGPRLEHAVVGACGGVPGIERSTQGGRPEACRVIDVGRS